MAKYNVHVVRTSFAFRVIEVEADSVAEAKDIALDTAGDYEFSEKDAEYDINFVGKQDDDTAGK